MPRVANDEIRVPIDSSPGITLIGSNASVLTGWGSVGVGARYTRATKIMVPGREPIPIRDHVMTARLVVLSAILIASVWRSLR